MRNITIRSNNKEASAFRLEEVDPFLREAEFQFKVWSRVAAIGTQEWEQYREERQKDGNFSELEKGYFDEVIALIPDAIGAVRFSPTWTKAAREVQLSEAVDA